MNEKNLNPLRQQDNNLREAIARRASRCPQMPPDLNERLMERVATKPRRSFPALLKWASAAACIVAAFLIGNALIDNKQAPVTQVAKTETPAVIKTTETKQAQQTETPHAAKTETQPVAKADVSMTRTAPPAEKVVKPVETVTEDESTTTEDTPVYKPTAPIAEEARPVYASIEDETDEDSTYKSPSKVDEFIAQLAANYGVEQELHDSVATVVKSGFSNTAPFRSSHCTADSTTLHRFDRNTAVFQRAVYVFPDRLEADVMLRLMKIACWYGNTSPGYKLFMTQQQFIFELEDTRKGRSHMWFAEKEKNCTLLFCASAPIGEVISTACYLEFKEKISREIINM